MRLSRWRAFKAFSEFLIFIGLACRWARQGRNRKGAPNRRAELVGLIDEEHPGCQLCGPAEHSAEAANRRQPLPDRAALSIRPPAQPGDQLVLEVFLDRAKAGIFKFRGRGSVGDETAVEAELMCTMRRVA